MLHVSNTDLNKYTHRHRHTNTDRQTDRHTHTQTRTHARTHTSTHTRTHARTHARTHTHTHTGVGGVWLINYMQIWRDEFLRLAWKKMLMLGDKHHTVMSSTVSGPWKKKLVVQRSLFLWKVCGMFWCQKWSEVVWMDGRQPGVQKDRLNYHIAMWLWVLLPYCNVVMSITARL